MNLKKGICMALIIAGIITVMGGCSKPNEEESSGVSEGVSQDISSSVEGNEESTVSTPVGNISEEDAKKLIEEYSSGDEYEALQEGYTLEQVGDSTGTPVFNIKDKEGKTLKSVIIIGDKPVELNTPNKNPIENIIIPSKPGGSGESSDSDPGSGQVGIFYSYTTNTDPARFEVGIVKGTTSFYSAYTGIRTEYKPKLRETDSGDVIVTITDGGKEIDLCKLVAQKEMGEYFVDIVMLDNITDEQRAKYTLSQGDEGYVE